MPRHNYAPRVRQVREHLEERRRLATRERVTFTLPVLDEDPHSDGDCNAWLLSDGRLRWRDYQGRVHEAQEARPGPAGSASPRPEEDR